MKTKNAILVTALLAMLSTASLGYAQSMVISRPKRAVAATPPTYVTQAAQREGAGQATVTVDISGFTISAGDLLLAVVSTPTSSTTWSNTVGGMTEVRDGPIAAYRKTAVGDETSLTFVCSLDSGAKGVVVMHLSGGTYADVEASDDAAGSATTTIMPSVTAALDSSLWVEVGLHHNAITDPENWTAPDGTHNLEHEDSPGNNLYVAVGTKVVVAGATGTATWSHSSSGSTKRSVSFAISPQ